MKIIRVFFLALVLIAITLENGFAKDEELKIEIPDILKTEEERLFFNDRLLLNLNPNGYDTMSKEEIMVDLITKRGNWVESEIILKRGKISILHGSAIAFTGQAHCDFDVYLNGQNPSLCKYKDVKIQNILDNDSGIDSINFEIPNSEGYVSFYGWEDNIQEAVRELNKLIRTSLQSRSNKEISRLNAEYLGFAIPPTLIKEKNVLFYATKHIFTDKELNRSPGETLNITAVIFDRYGFIPFKLVPTTKDKEKIKETIIKIVNSYSSNPGEDYKSFKEGDKVNPENIMNVFALSLGYNWDSIIEEQGYSSAFWLFLEKWWWLFLFGAIFIGPRMFNFIFQKKSNY